MGGGGEEDDSQHCTGRPPIGRIHNHAAGGLHIYATGGVR